MAYLYSTYPSPIGTITLSSNGSYLIGLWFNQQKNFPEIAFDSQHNSIDSVISTTYKWLDKYFEQKIPDFNVPILLSGTQFQKEVWNLLLAIPYSQTTTYGELATKLSNLRGKYVSARAIGSTVGRNPISIIVPCHRVLGTDNKLTGYAGGIERKQFLLSLEGINNIKLK